MDTTTIPITDLGAAAATLVEDYEQRAPPFADAMGITTSITDSLPTNREKALFLTLTTALNRQRDAEMLYSKFARLWADAHWIFEPATLIQDADFAELMALFEEEGVRFGEQDAKVWYEISRTLYHEYDADPMELLDAADYDMQRLEELVRTASGETRFFAHGRQFPVLRGDKILPVWLRLISNQVHPLGRSNGTDIAVDTHIIQVTNRLLGTAYSRAEPDKERIRQFWREVCETQNLNPIDVDGPLWYINRDWDEWGRTYLRTELEEQGLDCHADGQLALE